jgi:tight adherence protein B
LRAAILVAGLVFLMAIVQAAIWGGRGRRDGDEGGSGGGGWDDAPPLSGSASLAALLRKLPGFMELRRLQSQAGSESSTAAMVFSSALLAAVAAGVTAALVRSMAAGLAVGLFVPLGAWVSLQRRRALRGNQVAADLPQALRALARLANSGQAPSLALQHAGQELGGTLHVELRRVFDEQRRGRPLVDALRAMSERVPTCVDLRILVTAFLLSTEAGGNLGELLAKIEDTISRRIAMRQKAQAETAQARLNAALLCVVVPLAVVLIWFLEPDYLLAGWNDRLGRVLYGAAAAWMTVGALVIANTLRGRE